MEALISDWVVFPSKLKIRVSTEPLGMAKEYIWANHTTNTYGQGREWAWWHVSQTVDPTSKVFGEDAQALLSQLVRNHRVLGLLIDHYKIPRVPE